MKIAIAATNASTAFGGEALVPYQLFCMLLNQGVDVKLLTHARNQVNLEQQLDAEALKRVYFVPDTPVQKWVAKVGLLIPEQIRAFSSDFIIHSITQRYMRKLIRQLARESEVDVVHEPIPVSPKLPSSLHGLHVPVVMGPMNGAMEYPEAFINRRSLFSRIYMALGRACSDIANKVIPGKREADVLLVANARSESALPKGHRGKVMRIPEGGVHLPTWKEYYSKYNKKSCDGVTRFIYVGALIDCKAVDLLLQALAQAELGKSIELTIVGDGPKRQQLEALAQSLNIGSQVHFKGWLDRREVPKVLGQADVFVFPSLKDCGGTAILEAMAMHLPVICARWGGPADYVTEDNGILIDPISRDHYIDGLASALRRLHATPELRERLGEAGYQRLSELYSWDSKITTLKSIYQTLLNNKP